MTFFVAGLPRSRTAWLANFLTYDGSFCYHEGINGCKTIGEYRSKIEGKGDACTGLPLIDVERHFPDAKKLIIHSSIEKSIDWSDKAYGIRSRPEIEWMSRYLDSMTGMHINYDDIDALLPDIWGFLVETPYDVERGNMISGLHMQTRDKYDYDKLSASMIIENSRATIQ